MKNIKESNRGISTILALALIPITGFVLDVYIPSLPAMSAQLGVSPAAIQSTITIFLVAYGISQLLVGGLLDNYGRYRPNLIALAVFSLASFIIANTGSLYVIYLMRVVQGVMAAIIIVSKRSFFIDLFTGEKLKRYTSLFSVIWSAAPIIAPFAGGFLQVHFGWRSNFYFLGIFGLVFFFLELTFSGETIAKRSGFSLKNITNTYRSMLQTRDFIGGVLILGLSYGVLMVYNMSSPFLIEKSMHFPASVTGNCAMVSGLSMLAGGLASRALISSPLFKKIIYAVSFQLVAAIGIMAFTINTHNLYTLMAYVILLHSSAGFIFNTMLAYCLTRFSRHGGTASGLTGGGYIISTSLFSYAVVNILTINNQVWLGVAYSILIISVLVIIIRTKWVDETVTAPVVSKHTRVAVHE